MKVRVGSAPISWGVCEIEGWGPQIPYPQVLDEHVAAGYEGTELGPWGYLPQDVDRLRDELARRGLAMASAFVPLNLREPEHFAEVEARVRGTAELLQALGAKQILLSDQGDVARKAIAGRPELTRTQGLSDEEWPRYVAALERLARLCDAEYRLRACFHPHGGTYIESAEEIDRLMRETDPALIGLCLDTGHIAFGGGDPVAITRAYADRIGFVHLKDIRLERLRQCVAAGQDYTSAAQQDVFVELGRGSLDVPAIMDAMTEAGYSGWIIIEQDRVAHPGTDMLASAKASRDYLRERFGV